MGDIAACSIDRIVLLEPSRHTRQQREPRHLPEISEVSCSNLKDVVERSVLDGQQAIHVGLADRELRIQGKRVVKMASAQPNGTAGRGAIAIHVSSSRTVDLPQATSADNRFEDDGKQHVALLQIDREFSAIAFGRKSSVLRSKFSTQRLLMTGTKEAFDR
jgi:hypothetical protein